MRLELNCQRILSPSCRMTDSDIYLYLEPRPQLGNLTAQWKYQCQRLKCAPTFFSKLRAKIDKHWWHMVAGSSDATVAAEQLGIYTKDLRNIIPSSKLRQMWKTHRLCIIFLEKPLLLFRVYVSLPREQQNSTDYPLTWQWEPMARVFEAYPIGCSHTPKSYMVFLQLHNFAKILSHTIP